MEEEKTKEIISIIGGKLKEKKKINGKLIFGMMAGSWGFNLNVPTSDIDWFGVYIDDIRTYLSLNPSPDTIDCKDPDLVIHEFTKFIKLVLKGNPKLIEPLFCNHYCYKSEEYIKSFDNNTGFLSIHTLDQYVSYSRGKVMEWKKNPGKDIKNLYHAIRLISEAKRMVEGNPPKVWWEGKDREHLMAIRRSEVDPEKILQDYERMEKEVVNCQPKMQKEVSIDFCNKIILEHRMKNVKQNFAILQPIKKRKPKF